MPIATSILDISGEARQTIVAHSLTPGMEERTITATLRVYMSPERILRMVTVLYELAIGGDLRAIDTIMDRLDGRIPIGIVGNTLIQVVHGIPRPIIDAQDADAEIDALVAKARA